MQYIDTHTHIDGEEFKDDLDEVIARAKEAGAKYLFVPGINWDSIATMQAVCDKYPGYVYQMLGLHPEDVKEDYNEVLDKMYRVLTSTLEKNQTTSESSCGQSPSELSCGQATSESSCGQTTSESCGQATSESCGQATSESSSGQSSSSLSSNFTPPQGEGTPSRAGWGPYIAVGEVGLDYYWTRDFEKEQLKAFERQVEWSIETRLPLMIHCRKAQNEMIHILRPYEKELPGGVFHCFSGNQHEAMELLQFDKFVLGVGGVCTFKKSHLPEDLPAAVPLDRIVLETDAPYMAPVPNRGQRNEPSFVPFVIKKLAEAYQVSEEEIASITTATAERMFLC